MLVSLILGQDRCWVSRLSEDVQLGSIRDVNYKNITNSISHYANDKKLAIGKSKIREIIYSPSKDFTRCGFQ